MKWLHFFIVSLFLCSVNNTFAISKSKQFVIQRGNKTFLVSNNQEYEIYRIITVKYTDLLKLQNKYIVRRFNKLSYADIDIPNNISIDSFVDELEKDTNIQQIDYNGYGNYQALVPNDSRISHQWYLSLIRANEAWEITTGSPLIKVGILDSGIDWLHPDLGMGSDSYQNIYCNPNEDDWSNSNDPTTGNNTDDDNNNLIDDYKGWNFVTNTNDCRTTVMHGTFVAGIIGAKTNNNIGIAGIAGGNNSKGVSILPYCVGIEEPKSDIIDDAIIAAVDNGCHIIQFSLSAPYTQAINTALEYAKSQNVIVVCCSGNHSMNSLPYPASHPSVIAVGAINQNSRKASFSNYGTNLSVVAPGVDIYSTTLSSNLYGYSEGTSFAAPQVSAVIALMLSVNPYLSCDEVRNIIESTAHKIESYKFDVWDDCPNGTWNNQVGYGLIDAYAAVLAARNMIPKINGPEILSTQSTYSVTNVPVGASIKWTYTFNPSNTHTQMHRFFDPIIFVNGDSTTSVLVERGKYPAVDSMIVGPVLPPGGTILNIGNISTNDVEYRYFTGTAVLKATITSGGYSYSITKTITLSSSSTTALALEVAKETEDIIEDNANLLNRAPLPSYNLRHVNPISSSNAIIYIDKLLGPSNVYVPNNEKYTIEIWHHQLGFIKRICDTTSNLYLDCGDLPTGVYQMILIINGEPVAQSKLLKL